MYFLERGSRSKEERCNLCAESWEGEAGVTRPLIKQCEEFSLYTLKDRQKHAKEEEAAARDSLLKWQRWVQGRDTGRGSFAIPSGQQYPTLNIYLINSFIHFYFMCRSVLPACLCMYGVHAWCLQGSEEGVISPRAAVTDGCEPPWVLGIKSESSVGATSALDWGPVSATLELSLKTPVIKLFFIKSSCLFRLVGLCYFLQTLMG